jgi:hypothetical protein
VISQSRNIDLNSVSSILFGLLVDMNATMRRIDLLCKLGGPLFVSLLTIPSPSFAAWFLAGFNFISFPFEYFFILVVHKQFPDLETKAPRHDTAPKHFLGQVLEWPQRTLSSWKTYYNSPLFLASLALCILYFTVLSFGGIPLIKFSNFRLHDRFPLPIFRFFYSPDCRLESDCSINRHRRNFPLTPSYPLHRFHPHRNLVPLLANNSPHPRHHCNLPPPLTRPPRRPPSNLRVPLPPWSLGLRSLRAISRATRNRSHHPRRILHHRSSTPKYIRFTPVYVHYYFCETRDV